MLREFKDQGLVILAVDFAEPKKTVTKFLAESPRECKIVLMTDTNLAAWFSPKSFPHYAVIDPKWNSRRKTEGRWWRAVFEALVE